MHTQVGVGSVNNTFGIKGVEEQCYFLKSIEDAHRLRVRRPQGRGRQVIFTYSD